jgi:hypothetical protein
MVGVALWLLAVACSSPPPSGLAVASSVPKTPSDLTVHFFELLADGQYRSLSDLVVDDHIPLLSLSEMDRLEEVVAALADETEVSANYWESFAAGVEALGGGELASMHIVGEEESSIDGQAFVKVEIRLNGGGNGTRRVVVREQDGWRLDPLATFSPAIASRLLGAVGDLLERPSPAAVQILEAFRRQSSSLAAAAELWPTEITGEESRLALMRLADLLASSG